MDQIVVIGAGAAGIFAALRAAEICAMGSRAKGGDTRVIVLEKTSRIGTKILMSGGGKCNVAHDGPLEEVLRAFRPNEARFIRPACYRLTNQDIVSFFVDRGLRVYTRPNGRVFPIDQTAKDVVAILHRELDLYKIDVRLNTPVLEVLRDEHGVIGVETPQETILARRVILAAGGSSYPKSGTTGDGFTWAAALGHSIVPVRAALAPILMADWRWRHLSGVSFRDCVLKARHTGKEIARWRDDLLVTHTGVSGPCALGISREVAEKENVKLEVDVLPDRSFEEVSSALISYGAAHPRRLVATYLQDMLPERLVSELLKDASVSCEQVFADLSRSSRNRIVEILKGWALGEAQEADLEKGEVVAGGIALDEVDPKTMESRICPRLYCCGEALDVAGPVGGYNLQAAFATGWVAGESAATS